MKSEMLLSLVEVVITIGSSNGCLGCLVRWILVVVEETEMRHVIIKLLLVMDDVF